MKRLCILCLIGSPATGFAQEEDLHFSNQAVIRTLDVSTATKGSLTTVALSINQLHGLGRSHRFRIGYGLRITSAFGGMTDYKTAPAELVKGVGKGSVIGLFSKSLDENIDTLRLAQTQAQSVNVSLHLEYAVSRRFALGVNIDAVGCTFGPAQSGTFIANSPARSVLNGSVQAARLTSFNLLLGDQSDRGSLNSEGYVRYRLNPRISGRAGLSFQFNEYTTDRKLTFGNDRFRSSNLSVLVAVAYHLKCPRVPLKHAFARDCSN